MRRFILTLWAMVSATALGAQDSSLEHLQTSEAGRAWEAVGRLDVNGQGFCTGALIAPDLVLTAAHCLFDKATKERIDHSTIEFRAGWRNGRASAYRFVRRAVVHPDYIYDGAASSERVSKDIAILELQRPIRNTTVVPFRTATRPRKGDKVGVVSYARDRAEAPALQEVCAVMGRQQGVLVMSCNVDFGSSGAPIFRFNGGHPEIVSIVSAKADLRGQKVSLGTALDDPLPDLIEALRNGAGYLQAPPPGTGRIEVGQRRDTGAKFVRP